jgi:hypothetical protein
MFSGLLLVIGCAGPAPAPTKAIYQSGLNEVRLEKDTDSKTNSHPVNLSATDVATVLRGVRVWEERNFIHRLISGDPDRMRAFRNEEILLLAPSVSKALAQAGPDERVYFHLSHPTEQGEEETTTGWLSIRDPILVLSLSEVHDRHGPGPDIHKYDRQMPDVPLAPTAFDVTFEPEEYLLKARSRGRLFAPGQREELHIRYRDALAALPIFPGLDSRQAQPVQP